jgi:hypothetical protein
MNKFGAPSGAPTPFWKVRFGALSTLLVREMHGIKQLC